MDKVSFSNPKKDRVSKVGGQNGESVISRPLKGQKVTKVGGQNGQSVISGPKNGQSLHIGGHSKEHWTLCPF